MKHENKKLWFYVGYVPDRKSLVVAKKYANAAYNP